MSIKKENWFIITVILLEIYKDFKIIETVGVME